MSEVPLFFEKMHKVFKNKVLGCSTPLTVVILVFLNLCMCRWKKRSNPESQNTAEVNPASTETTSQHKNNPTNTQHSETTNDPLYHTVQAGESEYTYIETNTSPHRTDDEDVYTYAETPAGRNSSSSPNPDSAEEGWKDNTIYVSADDASAQNAEEGWTENSVYGK